MKGTICLGLSLLAALAPSAVWAELKVGYIDSQILRDKLPEFKDAQRTLDRLRQQYDKEALERENDLRKMQDDFNKQELLMSEARKQELQELFDEKLKQHQEMSEKIYGPEGELMRKNAELSQPIFDRVNQTIQAYGKEEGFDFILDVGTSGSVIYAPDKYNLTEKMLERLEQERKEAEKGRQ